MLVVLGSIIILLSVLIICYCKLKMKKDDVAENYDLENLRKRIDELDDENLEANNSSNGSAKIVVPDEVDVNDATKKSTQKEECKEYEINNLNAKIEKTIISEGKTKTEENFVNDEILINNKNDDDNNPIQENDGIISKLLKDKEE